MKTISAWTVTTLGVVACVLSINAISYGQAGAAQKAPTPVTSRPVSTQSNLVTLEGNTPGPARNAKNDRGMVADDFAMPGMEVLLKRPAAEEKALEDLIEQMHKPGSANYHKWLTAAQFAKKFGVPESNVSTVKSWLQSQGFKIDGVQESGLVIMFSGTAGQVREAFHTEIHNLQLKNGETHFSNISDPQVPANIASLIVGPVSLGNFMPHTLNKQRVTPATAIGKTQAGEGQDAHGNYTFTSDGATTYALVPGDVATIYNLNPLFAAGYTGKGSTISVVEDSLMYATADWTTFQSTFGLSSYGGTLTQTHPTGSVTCTAPTVNAADGEVEIDAEYALAAAPGATINVASCKDATTYGELIAVQNLVNGSTPPPVISMSYGVCEAALGSSANAAFNTAYQQAVTEGTSMFVASGDESSTSCDANDSYATHGVGVSGFTSTPYNVSVGGTDFYDGYENTYGTYWSTTNGSYYNSAVGYVPEIPWNDSCAGQLLANYYFALGDTTTPNTYGSASLCNTGNFLTTGSGSGGPSGCATGSPSKTDVVGGTCKGYAKPTWQTGIVGNPSDTVRDIPDVSLFASNGFWGHYYVVCYSDPTQGRGGATCTAGNPSVWSGFGGTSVSSPIMAGIQTLVNQYVGNTTNGTGALQGNPNYVYYALANQEYGSAGSSTCNSDANPSSSCVFYDVTVGDNNVPCAKDAGTLYDCYLPSGTYGVGSASTMSFVTTYNQTNTGWDFATGIGTVNAYNLATGWGGAFPTQTALTANPTTVVGTGTTKLTATVTAANKDNSNTGGTVEPITGTVTFYTGASALGTCTLVSATCSYTTTVGQLNEGANNVTAVYSGNHAYPPSTSNTVVVTYTADISFSSVTHNFGSIAVGTTTSGTTNYGVQLTNHDSSAFPFSLNLSGSSAFTANTNCGSSVAAGATCEIVFVFAPTATGTVSATWSVGANGKLFSPSNGGTLTGTGLGAGAVTLTTAAHAFGLIGVNVTSPAYGVVLTNSTTSAVTLTLGSVSAPFVTSANNCPASLAAGGSCNLQFEFKPTATVASTATFSISANGGAVPITTGSPATTVTGISLSGTGVATAGLTLTSAGHNFGNVFLNTTSAAYLTQLTNSTASAVTLTVGTPLTAPYITVANNCPASLASGQSCSLEFEFKPTTATQSTQTLTLSAGSTPITSGGAAVTGITLTGIGINAETYLTLTRAAYPFGSLTRTQTATFGAVLTNNTSGSVTLTLGPLTFTPGSGTDPFSVTGNNCPVMLVSGASCNLVFTFAPTSRTATSYTASYPITAKSGATTVTIEAGGAPVTGVSLTGSVSN